MNIPVEYGVAIVGGAFAAFVWILNAVDKRRLKQDLERR